MALLQTELNGGLQGSWIRPDQPCPTGMVVLGGSSGAVPIERARLLAELGIQVVALRWFGGSGQSPGICEIPLETFVGAIDFLESSGCRRVAILGTSKGAEAALLVGTVEPRIELVVAVSSSSVVWANVGPGVDGFEWPQRSSFTWRGSPLAFVPHRAEALLSVNRIPPIRYLGLFNDSLQTFAEEATAAAIPIERAVGELILAAGDDDRLWPSARFARDLSKRLQKHGKSGGVIIHPDAGHRILFPGESATKSKVNEHGGTDEADAAVGALVFEQIALWASRAQPAR